MANQPSVASRSSFKTHFIAQSCHQVDCTYWQEKMSLHQQQWKPVVYILALSMILSESFIWIYIDWMKNIFQYVIDSIQVFTLVPCSCPVRRLSKRPRAPFLRWCVEMLLLDHFGWCFYTTFSDGICPFIPFSRESKWSSHLRCLQLADICDGTKQCASGSDEINCG